MKARANRVVAAAGILAMASSVLIAGPAVPQTGMASPVAAPNGLAGTRLTPGPAVRTGAIVGGAWQADNTPIPQARVRLRNVVSGRMHAVAVADDLGQFAFQLVEPGSYLVELVAESGKVLTVGHTFSLGIGETVATFVRLATKVPWFTGFFGNAAAAVAATAAAAGVTALAPEAMTCASPPCGTGGGK